MGIAGLLNCGCCLRSIIQHPGAHSVSPLSFVPNHQTLWNEVVSKLNLPFVWGGGKEIHGEYSIASNKTVTIFKAKTTDSEEDVNFNEKQAHIEIERIHIVIEYESVYGEKFIEKFNET
jgi:hypothetical protein